MCLHTSCEMDGRSEDGGGQVAGRVVVLVECLFLWHVDAVLCCVGFCRLEDETREWEVLDGVGGGDVVKVDGQRVLGWDSIVGE